MKTSVEKLLEPEPVEVSAAAIAVMAASVAFKVWLGAFNRHLGRKTDSPAFNAVAMDSMTDCVATSVVIACLLMYWCTGYNLDGAAGIVVGIFIMKPCSPFWESLRTRKSWAGSWRLPSWISVCWGFMM